MADVGNPATDRGLELGEADLARMIGGQAGTQPPVVRRTLRAFTRRWVG